MRTSVVLLLVAIVLFMLVAAPAYRLSMLGGQFLLLVVGWLGFGWLIGPTGPIRQRGRWGVRR